MNDRITALMEGAYDVHLHATPCLTQRRASILQMAEYAKNAGMKGFVVKDHQFSTAPQALMAREAVPGAAVIGGVTLNASLGGLNPEAVESTFKLGGKVVWMFSLESAWMLKQMQSPDFGSAGVYQTIGVKPGRAYTVFLDSGALKEEAREIIALCKQYDAVLETSHLSPEEGFAVTKEAAAQGFHKVVITHANQDVTPYTAQDQRALADLGATVMYCMAAYMSKPGEPVRDISELPSLIRTVGPERVVLGTDFGLYYLPPAVEGMRMMIGSLLLQGVRDGDIRLMVKTNPAGLYGD